jgi:hypothetical protein
VCASGDFGKTLGKLITALSPARLISRGAEFAKTLAKRSTDVMLANKGKPRGTADYRLAYQDQGSFTRLRPQDNGKDNIEEFDWVPQAFPDMNISFEQVRTSGCPWYSLTVPGLFRGGLGGIPLNGVGQFIMSYVGSSVVFIWPFSDFTALNVWPEDAPEFIRRQSQADADNLIGKAKWCVAHVGNVIWIPYGHSVMTVALQSAAGNVGTVTQPLITTKLLNRLDQATKDVLLNACDSWYQSVGGPSGKWSSSYGPLLSWMQECGAVMDDNMDYAEVDEAVVSGTPNFGANSAALVLATDKPEPCRSQSGSAGSEDELDIDAAVAASADNRPDIEQAAAEPHPGDADAVAVEASGSQEEATAPDSATGSTLEG